MPSEISKGVPHVGWYCERCKKKHQTLAAARTCCGLDKTPCLDCKAKNFCQNKDSSNGGINAIPDPSAGPQLKNNGLWEKRGCAGPIAPRTGSIFTEEELNAEIKRLQALKKDLQEVA